MANDVQIIHQLKLRVQLADGLDTDGWLSGEAIDRGLDNLQYIVESLKDFEPDQVRAVATYTLRKARNANDFLKAAKRILPYPIEVISGIEEARLIYLGVAHTSHHDGSRLVIDIGGGSTEIVIGEAMEPRLLRSLSVGCVTFTKRYFKSGKIKSKAFGKAITHARQEIEAVSDSFLRQGWQHCLGSSGTIRAIVELVSELDPKATVGEVTLSQLHTLIKKLVDAGHVGKLKFKTNLSDERRRVLPAGLAILTAIFESLRVDSLEYSPAALREGVIYDMEDRLHHLDIRERTAASLVTRYVVDIEQANRVLVTTLSLYDQVREDWQIGHADERALLGWAAMLHEVGLHINAKGVHRHSAYILQNVELPGFNAEEQHLLATLVRFQRKRIQKADLREFLNYAPPEIRKLIVLLRLGVLLNFKRQDDVVPQVSLEVDNGDVRLCFPDNWLDGRPIFRSNLEREHVQIRVLGFSLIVAD